MVVNFQFGKMLLFFSIVCVDLQQNTWLFSFNIQIGCSAPQKVDKIMAVDDNGLMNELASMNGCSSFGKLFSWFGDGLRVILDLYGLDHA